MLDTNYTTYLYQLSETAANQSTTTAVQGSLDFPDLPDRCDLEKKRNPVTYAYLPWGWITNSDLQPTIQTLGSTHSRHPSRFGPHTDDILVIPDTSKYQYRFIDWTASNTSSNLRTSTNATYSEDIPLIPLADYPAKLIQLGSIFGSRRLKLSDPTYKVIRKQTRRHMSLKHPPLQKSSADITARISSFGSGFIGVHLRCNDSYFLETAAEYSRMIWWKLVHGILGLSIERTRQWEFGCSATAKSPEPLPSEPFISPSKSPAHPPLDYHNLTVGVDPMRKCKGELHTDTGLERLNVPLFIATDSKDPYTDKHLSLYSAKPFPAFLSLETFPKKWSKLPPFVIPSVGWRLGIYWSRSRMRWWSLGRFWWSARPTARLVGTCRMCCGG